MTQLAQKIIIADDHPLFRTAMQQAALQLQPDVHIEQADTLPALQEQMERHSDADLVLLDLHMPGAHGFSGLLYLRSHFPHMPVIVVSACEDAAVMCQSIDYQASGYITKSASLEEMCSAITQVLNGDIYLPQEAKNYQHTPTAESLDIAQKMASLTPQQFRVLSMMKDGLLNKQIACDLSVSEATIKAHITAIFKKMGVRTRTQAVIAVRHLDIESVASLDTMT